MHRSSRDNAALCAGVAEQSSSLPDRAASKTRFSRKPGHCHKKEPQAVIGAWGLLSSCLNLGSYLAGRRGVGGSGAARLAHMHENKSAPRGYNAERFYRKIRRPYGIPWCHRDATH